MNNEIFRRYIDIINEAAPAPTPPTKLGTVQKAAQYSQGQEVSGNLNISALKALMPTVDSGKLAAAMTAIKTGKLTPAHYQIMGIAFQQLVNADAATTIKIMNLLKKVEAGTDKPAAPIATPGAATTMK